MLMETLDLMHIHKRCRQKRFTTAVVIKFVTSTPLHTAALTAAISFSVLLAVGTE
jgi:hypothetical protein